MDKYAVWVRANELNPKADGVYVTRLIKARLVSACEFVSAAGGWNTSYKPEMFEWLDENPSPVDRGVEKAEEIFGLDNSWPLSDVLNKLIEAAHILLHKKDYDGHGWEEINHAVNRGKEIVKAIAGAKLAGNDADYWKRRCEAAEKVISCIPDRKENLYELGFHQALKIWQTLKEKQL